MDKVEKSKRAGKFILAQGEEIYGELTVSGANTALYLRNESEFSTHAGPNQYIKGVLHDLTKVSLIDCVTPPLPGHASKGSEQYYFVSLFPHFVIYGDRHVAPDDKTIESIHFSVDDATTLFYDFDAFGILLNARAFIKDIVQANADSVGRQIDTGVDPQILYFTGKRGIFAAKTVIGKVSASHNPRPTTFGGPSGVGLKNTIFLTIEFPEPVVFEQSIRHLSTLLRYLEMLAGRPQNLVALELQIKSDQKGPGLVDVYWSMRPKRKPHDEEHKPHPSDVLLDPIRGSDEFSRVLANWLDREQSWSDARARFSNGFAEQNHYTIDRLIGAANMFDILPTSAVPSDVPLPNEIEAARELSRNAFLPLKSSPERDSVLSALGRIGKASLKRKIRHRAEKIIGVLGGQFGELPTVIDEAVNCRNHYVHGTEPRFDYNANFHMVTLFTDTLEFVFAASDLIEAGWDAKKWSSAGTVMSHPFARFRINFAKQLEQLKGLLPS
ncbi:MAG TPA: HEPN domain-containing protein [Verrucomicrobiae bacterium]|nr:HEPN domain-containing protein [Verrucomicrobiae bacterium]